MNEKINAVYIDNSKVFTDFMPVYIVLEEDDFKIRIGRTLLNVEKAKGFVLRVEGMRKNVYLTIKTPRKTFEFRDIDYKYVSELKKFEKEFKTRKPRKSDKNENVVNYQSSFSAAAAANKTKLDNKTVTKTKELLNKKTKTEDTLIKVETFIPRLNFSE